MDDTYEPEVDDYVVWEKESWDGKSVDEGWVYFKAPVMEDKKGFISNPRYITIETGVRPKPQSELEPSNGKKTTNPHTMVHTLLLCYEHQWKELRFVRRRKTKHCQHYAQYDDVN